MKKFFSLAIVAMLAVSASAQITWNAKLGGGFSFCAGMNDDGDTKAIFVGKIGVGIEKPLTENISLMPSLEVAIKGTKWSYKEDGYSADETLNPIYVQIPILGAYRFNLDDDWNLTFKVGPYFAYGVAGDAKYKGKDASGNTYSETESLFGDFDAKRFDAGVDVGIDFEYHRFVFGAEFERGFMSFSPDDADFNIYNQAFYVTLGYKF